MSTTEISPSQSIESSLLGYSNTPPSPSAFPHSPLRNQSHDIQEPILTHQMAAAIESNPDLMDHQPTPPPNDPEEFSPPSPPPANLEAAPVIDGQDHDRMVVDSNGSIHEQTAQPASQDSPMPPSLAVPSQLRLGDFADLPPPQAPVAIQSAQISPTVPSTSNDAGDGNVDVSARERSATESSTDNTQEMEEDSDEDDYDGHMEFLNHFREDASLPSDDELKEIEALAEKSGLDNQEWQKVIFTPLDDPEYVPGESGVITWTLQGFHGTKTNPNKKRIMRSPVVAIGGYKWNIKVFPHGNEGTDHISVYVECLGEGSTIGEDEMETLPSQDIPNSENAEQPLADRKAVDNAPVADGKGTPKKWDVAAQIGCVMYNPQEPRVWTFEKATHHFEEASQDWGWVRFYGPWSGIHQRRHMQRKPILQNDTLSFTAFIRTVKDPTKALWWRPLDSMSWNSVTKTGYRGLSAEEPAHHSFVASLAPWLHLQQFRDLILSVKVPDGIDEPLQRSRPLFERLQEVLYKKHAPKGSSDAVHLHSVQHAFEWYEHAFTNSSDVVEIMESLRNVLNEEYYNRETSSSGPDVLGFINTIRQNMHPVLPSEQDHGPGSNEPHSVQEVLDDASKDTNSKYKDWDGFDQSSLDSPSVLQVELHRQEYDTQNRKWKKLTHKIKLDELVNWNGVQFTLFGVVIHKGELGSGRFYSVVRPGGSASKWVRYKSSVTSYLTQRQAVESHEGKGDAREGTESVAYLAIYVRSDDFHNLAPVQQEMSDSGVIGPLLRPQQPLCDLPNRKDIPIVVHKSSTFLDRQGTGLVDPWSLHSGGRYELRMSPAATLRNVQEELISKFNAAGRPEQCRLWPMRTSLPTVRYLPPFEQSFGPGARLLDFAERLGGVHLWLHIIPSELILDPLSPTPLLEPLQGAIPSYADVPEPSSTESLAPLEPPPDSSDVVMGGTQEQPNVEVPMQGTVPEPPIVEPPIEDAPASTPSPKASAEEQWQLQDQRYFLIKKFDPETQRMIGSGSFFVPPTERIRTVLPRLVTLPESFKVYHENDSMLDEPDLPPDATFSSNGIVNGSILVAQPDDLSEATADAVYHRGEALTVPELFQTLTFGSHFSFFGPVHISNYFGGPYTHAPLRNGRFFGQCTMIDDTTGDAYVGNCVGGVKSGQGVMYYANNDTYTGEWANSLPEGQGTMVYHTTGNTYVGGWKNGRRHGKGIMTYEVADEELQLCKICYESEMDALFYRCGHVAACETCARQVRDCPVCRRPVDSVVRIWKT